MPPDAIRWSISKTPFRRVPGGRRGDDMVVCMSIGLLCAASPRVRRFPVCGARNRGGRRRGIVKDCDDSNVVAGAAIECQANQEIAFSLWSVSATTHIYTLSLHDALPTRPISVVAPRTT